MKSKPKVVIITSDQQRHKYFVSTLSRSLDIRGIISEAKAPSVSDFSAMSAEDQEIVGRHFRERDEAEARLLGTTNSFPEGIDHYIAPHGQTNTQEVLRWIEEREPEAILLYGSSIIKEPVLDAYNDRIINLHLGLSPYYRGSGTNFWPLVYCQPECVGATIHLAVRKVDAGSILHQVRPEAEPADRAHELGTKTIMAAIAALPAVVTEYLEGNIIPQPQDLSHGKVFRTKDFNAEAVKTMWNNLEQGMIGDYVAAKELRDAEFPIITAFEQVTK